jgi:hypothetical protein
VKTIQFNIMLSSYMLELPIDKSKRKNPYSDEEVKSLQEPRKLEILREQVCQRNGCEILRSSEVHHGHCTACTKRRISELLDRESVFIIIIITLLLHKGF